MSLKSLFESVDPSGDLFSEAVIESIEVAIKTRIDEKTEEVTQKLLAEHQSEIAAIESRHAALVESAKAELDKSHLTLLEQLVESIDQEHDVRLRELADIIEKYHVTKTDEQLAAQLKEHNENVARVRTFFKTKHETNLVEAVGKYVDTIIDEVIPTAVSVDKVKLERYENIFTDMRKRLLVTDAFVQGEVKEAVMEAKSAIDARDAKLNELMSERTELEFKLQKMEADKLLESKVTGMDAAQAAYVRKFFENATHVKEINAKLNEAVSAYDATKRRNREILVEETKHKDNKAVKPVIPAITIPVTSRTPVAETNSWDSQYISKLARKSK